MAPRPPPPPVPNPDNPHLVGAIEAMIAAMQQQNAYMVNQQNLALQQMESARLAAEATQQRHLEALHQIGETVQPLVLPKLHCHECKSGVWRIFYNTIHPALMAKLARMELISGCGTWNESVMLSDVL